MKTSGEANGAQYGAGQTVRVSKIEVTIEYTPSGGASCSAPTSPSISGTTAYTAGDNISLTASASDIDASTTYTWYKGADWATASATSPVQAASTSGATFTKNSCVVGDAGTYWCNISNGTGCDVQVSQAITVACATPATLAISGASSVEVGSNTTLTVNNTGAGYGAVTWSSAATDKATVGSSTGVVTGVSEAALVTITATQAAGTVYCGSSATHDIEVEASSCTQYTVTAASNNNTYGTASAEAASLCEDGTTTITATPASGYRFVSWAVSGTGSSLSSTSTNPTTLTMGTANTTVTATFEAIPTHTLSAATETGDNSQGTVSVTPSTVAEGGEATITATPASGYVFDHWVVTGTGSSVDDASSATATLTMGTANTTVTAYFRSSGGGAGSCTVYMLDVAEVNTTASPNYYYNHTYGSVMKTKTGSSSLSFSSGSCSVGTHDFTKYFATGSNILCFKTAQAITGIIVYGKGTGNNRTLSSVEVGATTSSYSTVGATTDDAFESSSSCDSMHIELPSEVAANSYICVTFSGNINVYAIGLEHCLSCTPPTNALALDATATEITTAGSSTLSVTAGTGNGEAVTYTVTTNPGSAGSVTAGGVFTASASGTYVVTATQPATSGGECGGTATKTINVCGASVTAPTISDATDDNKVTITAAEGTIYYTTDGSTPTSSSTTIASGSTITIDADKTIKAIAINACGTSSTVTTKNVTFNPCAIETMVWNKSVNLPDGTTPSATSSFSAHSSVLTAERTGTAAEGSSLNSGTTSGSMVKISLVNPANVMDYVKFVGKIEDANLQYSTDEGANWTTLASTNTGGNATYQLTSLNASSIWLKSTGSSGFWLRNMQIKVCEEACTPVGTALSASASAASVTGGSGTVTVTLAGGNGGTIVPATPSNGTISAVDATHFTYTPAAVVTPTTVRLTFNQAKYSGYCAGSAYVDVTVNPSADPDIKVSKGSTEIAAGSSVDFTNVEIASAATTTTTETYTFTIEDLGLNDLEISSIVVTGDAFSGGCPGTCPTVSNGGSSTFTVSTVTGLAAGTYNGTVTINSNDPDENPYTFNIRYVVVPKYTVTVQFKTTAGASVSGATATIDGTTTSTNPDDVLVASGLQTITCTEPAGYTFHHWQIVGGASSSVKDYEFNVTGDMTIRAVYSVSACETIASADGGSSSSSFPATIGNAVVTNGSSSNSTSDATYPRALKLNTSGYITITAKSGSDPFVAGDSIIVVTWSSGVNKTHGFHLKSTSGNGVEAESPTKFATSRYALTEDDIEADGTIKVFRVSSDALFAHIEVKRCNISTVPTVDATITPADNSNNVDVNSNIVVTLPDDFYLGADCEALTHIDITENLDALTTAIKNDIIGNIKIYKFNEGTSSYDDVTSSFSGTAVGTAGTGVTVTFTHATPMSYTSQYRVEILNPGVSNELCDPAVNNISTFITGEEPLPQITVKDNGDVTTFANGASLNVANLMPAEGYGEAVIKIYNTGTVSGTLDISSMTITGDNASMFTIQSCTVGGASDMTPSLTKGGDPAIVTIRFTKASGMGTYHAILNIASNSTTDAAFALNLIGTKIDFELPYVYESGCTAPVADPTLGVRQDYTREGDVPSQITIGAGAEDSGADANVIPHYSLWSSLGGCSQNGESAIRVGDKKEGKAIHIDTEGRAIGKITVKWAANGLRKISIENAAGVPFAQSIGWETSNECHTTTAFINDCEVAGGTGTDEVYIRVYGPEDGAMAAISYLEITPCDPEIKSSACELINVTSANQQAGTSYTAQGTDGFIAVTDNCGEGGTFTPTTLTVSNGATISPKVGVAQTINAQGYVTYVVTAADAMTKKEYHVYPECQPVLDNSKCYASEITINSTNGGDIYKTSGDDKKIAVVATASDPGEACGIVMIDGNANGANHTVHYLDQDDVPDGGYIIDGPKSVCIGSVGTYRIINAPESNSPIYTWYLDHPNEAGFAVVGSEVTPASIASTLEAKFGAKATYLPQEVGEVLGIGQFVTTTVNVGTDLAPNNKLMDIYSGPELKLLAPDLIEDGEVSVALSLNFDFEDTNCRLLSGVASYSIKATSRSATPIVSVDAGCADENNRLVLTASQGSGVDVIEATKLDWTFSDPDVNILVASGNSVTVNIGRGAPDIEAVVIASNGCGTTDPNPTPIAVPYGTPATTWIGKVDNNWNNPANWTRHVPEACTDVTIAAVGETVTLPKGGNTTVSTYPSINGSDEGVCDEITFNRGAGVKGLEKLSYRRAYVKNAYQRNKWYTLTNPLKEMVSGDYYFNGVPLTYMKKYDATHSVNGYTYTQKWTKDYTELTEPLASGQGFAYQVTSRNMRQVDNPSAGDQEVIFPRMTVDSLLITELHKFNPLTGNLLSKTINLTKTENAYRFAFDGASVSEGVKTPTHSSYPANIQMTLTGSAGDLSLIGNPMMCHLDLGAFRTTNASVIENQFVFWNGETNTSVAINTEGTVATAAPAAGTKIAPMQGFFVKNVGNGGTLNFNVASHFVTDNGTYNLRSADASSDGTLYVTGNDGKTTSYLSVRKIEGASNGYVEGEDAEKIFNAYAVSEISTLAGGVATDINHFSALPYETPLAVNTTAEKDTVDLTFKGAESFENVNVTLVNKKTGEEINLKDENKYKFIFTKDEAETTLVLRFASDEEITTDAEQAEADASGCDVQIFTKGNNTVRVMSSSSNQIREVSIYDAAGKLIAKEVATGNGVTVMDKVLNAGARNVVVTAVTDNCVKTEILQLK
ncbi:MAG: chitobiase/beta-hexosaminidase C-terminal domain-containing protein [Paludibacteraceae bacterium]|nr:chitobiase/beta-hexosaminidase C-terminal domain-containing protein [Paludibacteraceae bacterium]